MVMAKKKYNHGPLNDAFKEIDKAASNVVEGMTKAFENLANDISRAFRGTKKHSAIMKIVENKTDIPKPEPKKLKNIYFWNRFFRDDYTKKMDGEYDK